MNYLVRLSRDFPEEITMSKYELKQLMSRASREIDHAILRESSKATSSAHGCVRVPSR